jgi:hypothetical protein
MPEAGINRLTFACRVGRGWSWETDGWIERVIEVGSRPISAQ